MLVLLINIDVGVVVFERDRNPPPEAPRPHRAHFGRLLVLMFCVVVFEGHGDPPSEASRPHCVHLGTVSINV